MAEQIAWLRVAFGAFMLVVGGLGVAYPYKIAMYGEMIDAIGSTRSLDDVEPAGWNVTLTRMASAVVAIVGLWWLFLGLGGA